MLESPFTKVAGLRSSILLNRLQHRCFPVKFKKLFKNTYLAKHLQTALSDGSESDDSENDDENYHESIEAVVRRYSSK